MRYGFFYNPLFNSRSKERDESEGFLIYTIMAKELPYFQFEPAEYLTKDISFCSFKGHCSNVKNTTEAKRPLEGKKVSARGDCQKS